MAKRRATWKVDRSGSKAGQRKRAKTILATAVAAHKAGDLATAEERYRHVLAISPENGEALRLLGTLYAQTGRTEAAIPFLERAVAAKPRDDDAHNNLALALAKMGRFEEAETHLRESIRLAPREAERYGNLGLLLLEGGRPVEAVALLEPAARRFPRVAALYTGLGLARETLGLRTEAVAALAKAAELTPQEATVRRNLGLLLAKSGRWEEARLHLNAARHLGGENAELLIQLGSAYYTLGEADTAETLFREALALEPDSAMGCSNLAAVHRDRGELAKAIALLEKAVHLDPTCAEAHGNLATCLLARGEHAAAGERDDRAVELQPEDLTFRSRRISRLPYREEVSPEATAADHRAWGKAVMARTAAVARPSWDGAVGRSLRVGYVSPDLHRHSVATFLEPILATHDPAVVEVACYSNVARPDTVTERLQRLVPHWRDISALTDDAAADAVVEDGIDVLVDLAGHTSRNRLGLFARRPAPVQATYLGYDATTGLPTMDFRITDGWLDPEGVEAYYSERLWRLASGRLCFQPPAEAGPVAGPPCVEAGHVTFGSFNNLAKTGKGVIALWAAILRRVEASRLLLKHTALGDGETRELVRHRFAAHGIDPARLELVGFTASAADHFALYQRVDIGLDPFPYGGCTTTCEALWMGVPVITLAGDRAVARYGISILSRLGRESLAVADGEAYVALAVALANRPEHLATLRHGLRDRVAASTLCQPTRITRELEAAYRGMVETVWRERRR